MYALYKFTSFLVGFRVFIGNIEPHPWHFHRAFQVRHGSSQRRPGRLDCRHPFRLVPHIVDQCEGFWALKLTLENFPVNLIPVFSAVATDGIYSAGWEAASHWILVNQFAELFELPMPVDYLTVCAAQNEWLNFLAYCELFQYPVAVVCVQGYWSVDDEQSWIFFQVFYTIYLTVSHIFD